MRTCRLLAATVVVLSLVAIGSAWAKEAEKAQEQSEYQIGPEDVLDISVWNNTSISRTVPVRPDGKIPPCLRVSVVNLSPRCPSSCGRCTASKSP
ncbi:MAG: polysaccharide biosynthesis/export family protein [candidate division NC10 bacterium]|nr:polysaccharide biosynthesis/export family protein [candidate division NC10 bacterium]